jgi:hypothetical protein
MKTPVGIRFGTFSQFSKDMTVCANFGYSTRAFMNCNMQTTMKKNIHLGVHYHFDDERKTDKIALGFELWYKCDDLLGDEFYR